MADMDIGNLASTLGLATNNRYVNTMPFTKAATTELNLAVQEKKEEAERLRNEKKLKDQIRVRIKNNPVGLDNIGQNLYKDAYVNVIANGASDPEMVYNLNELYQDQLAETKTLESISNTADKMLLPQNIKNAYKNRDYDYITKVAKENPNLGITITPSGRPLLDANRIVKDVSIDDYFDNVRKAYQTQEGMWLPNKVGKKERKFDKTFQEANLKPEILQAEADKIFTTNTLQFPEDQLVERNYMVKREKEIAKELQNPIYANLKTDEEKLVAAAKNVFMSEAQKKIIKSIDVTPRQQPKTFDQKSAYKRDANGVYFSETGGFTATPIDRNNKNNGELLIETKDKSPMLEQNFEFLTPSKLTEITDPVGSGNVIVRKIKYKGGDKVTIEGEVKGKNDKLAKIPQPIEVSLEQVASKFGAKLIDAITSDYNKANKVKKTVKKGTPTKSMAELMREAANKGKK